MTRKSFSVRIFLQDGCADGVKIVSRSKWSGRGLVIPRSALAAELDRAELKDPGVYLLSAPAAAADRPSLCIGAADRSEERRVGKECRSRWSPYH